MLLIPNPSYKQKVVINAVANNNVLVDSVAGSGKTTTILHIAIHYPEDSILVLTYNKKLKLDTQEKLRKLSINNVRVYTYHGFNLCYYNSRIFDDGILDTLEQDPTPKRDFKFDIIVIDEAQDIKLLYYKFICKLRKDNNLSHRLCILGDQLQNIYKFAGSDSRFMMQARKIYTSTLEWKDVTLDLTHRVKPPTAYFINQCLIKYDRLQTEYVEDVVYNKPQYLVCDTFNPEKLCSIISIYYTKYGSYDKIFVLAPSINKKNPKNPSPITRLENRIKKCYPKINIYVPNSDEDGVDDELIKGKLVFCTFHQSKGLERDAVIVLGFDSSYYEFFNRSADRDNCPNELYVAATRSSHDITFVHHYRKDFLPFMDCTKLHELCNVKMDAEFEVSSPVTYNTNDNYSVTDLIKNIDHRIARRCIKLLTITVQKTKNKLIKLPCRVKFTNTIEQVSDINGNVIIAKFENSIKDKISILDNLLNERFEENMLQILPYYYNNGMSIKTMDNKNITIKELLYLGVCWFTHQTNFVFKLTQIDKYDWIEESVISRCINRLLRLNIPKDNSEFETSVAYNRLSGFIDCIDYDNDIVYEFKCTKELTDDHILQTALYLYLYKSVTNIDTAISILYNPLSDVKYTIDATYDNLRLIYDILLEQKRTRVNSEVEDFFHEVDNLSNIDTLYN